jgi:hypothetical protein
MLGEGLLQDVGDRADVVERRPSNRRLRRQTWSVALHPTTVALPSIGIQVVFAPR